MTVDDLPTGWRGRLLAVAITAVIATALWVGAAAPLLGWYGERAERLDERATLQRRMEAVAAGVAALRGEAGGSLAGAAPAGADALLEGSTDAVAAARLQETIQALAARVGASPASLETLPAEPVGPYRRIGLRVTLSAPWPVLMAVLQAVDRATPPLLVDDLRVQGSRLAGAAGATPMDATFTVIAFRQAVPPTERAPT